MLNNVTHLPSAPPPRAALIGSAEWVRRVKVLKAALARARDLSRDIAAKATEGPAALVALPAYDTLAVAQRLAAARGVAIELKQLCEAADKAICAELRRLAELGPEGPPT
jgi:uncharacterized membrane protein